MIMYTSLPFSLSLNDSLLGVVGAGLGCHLVFNRFEPKSPLSHAALIGLVPALLTLLLQPHFSSIIQANLITFAAYHTTLLISICSYRLSPFHPLAKYPGPVLCKLTKFWLAYHGQTGKQYLYYKKLHEKYGSIVRIGPNELSITETSAVAPLMGPIGMNKGPAWEGRTSELKVKPLITIIDTHEHARRRRPWNRAFNTSSLKGYEEIISKRTLQLVNILGQEKSGAVDLCQWICYFTYDFMSDMAFGGGPEMMENGDKTGQWHLLESGQVTALFLGHVPWLARYYMALPGVGKDLKKFRANAIQRAAKRRTQGSHLKDLFHYLNDEEGIESIPPTIPEVTSDGGLAILAGSDTTASALSHICYFLMCHPAAFRRLRAEIDRYIPADQDVTMSFQDHPQMSYLNAVINEALRLFPPLLSGSQRTPQPNTGGKAFGSFVLPEGNNAFIHFYSIQRDPRYFSPMPDTFWPERWLSAKEREELDISEPGAFKSPEKVVHNTDAFLPFSFGPAMCVGKNLAYQELRMVLCVMVRELDFRFADGYHPKDWEDSLQDFLVTLKGALPAVVTARKH